MHQKFVENKTLGNKPTELKPTANELRVNKNCSAKSDWKIFMNCPDSILDSHLGIEIKPKGRQTSAPSCLPWALFLCFSKNNEHTPR